MTKLCKKILKYDAKFEYYNYFEYSTSKLEPIDTIVKHSYERYIYLVK